MQTTPPSLEAQDPSLRDLAAHMCRAQGPSEALVAAATAAARRLPGVSFVGLAVMAADRQGVRYHALLSTPPGATRLGVVAAASCAAGLAMDAKQAVHVRDLAQGDLGLLDLQYLAQEHRARCGFAAPLVLADAALGALCLAARQPNAFSGHEAWLHAVAAMCVPYVALLRSHQELLALEGLVSQVMPVRVALQMQDSQRRAAAAQPPRIGLHQLPGASPDAAGAQAGTQRGAAAGAGAALMQQPGAAAEEAGALAAAAAGAGAGGARDGSGSSSDDEHSAGRSSSLAVLRATSHLRQRQPQAAQSSGQAAAAGSPHLQQQQQQQHAAAALPSPLQAARAGWPSLAFQQPRLELAYQMWACQQWQMGLDAICVLLTLLSAAGGSMVRAAAALRSILAARQRQQPPAAAELLHLREGLAWLPLLAAGLWLLRRARRQPAARYLRWRLAAMAALRLARTALFCWELWNLQRRRHRPPGSAAGGEHSAAALPAQLPKAQAAACGLLAMLGLVGQLPLPWHAATQLLCVAGVAATLVLLSVHPWPATASAAAGAVAASAASPARLRLLGELCLLGWAAPVVAVAWVEWGARRHFLRRMA